MASYTRHILIAGLGNHSHPGTRHNVGMMVVDQLAKRYNLTWDSKNPYQSDVAHVTTSLVKQRNYSPPSTMSSLHGSRTAEPKTSLEQSTTVPGEPTTLEDNGKRVCQPLMLELKITLLKPLMAMNVSGSCVSRAAKDLKIAKCDIVVVHDDMERDLGKLSFKTHGSANGHNGIKSCIKSLGTQQFRRLRVGIGRAPADDRSPTSVAKYVLGKFKPLEVEKLEQEVLDFAADEIIRTAVSTAAPPKR